MKGMRTCNYKKLIVIFSLTIIIFSKKILCMAENNYDNNDDDDNCKPTSCASTTNNTQTNSPVIKSPFYIQPAAQCGAPGFKVHCESNSGNTLIEIPSIGTLKVESINYNNKEIELSDPNNCLPKKLLGVDLAGSPFQETGLGNWLYFCDPNQFDYYKASVQIGCLSNSTFKVISSGGSGMLLLSSSICSRSIKVPSMKQDSSSNFSSFVLTWGDNDQDQGFAGWKFKWILPAVLLVLVLMTVAYAFCKRPQSGRTATTTSSTSRNTNRGLDLATINSYPTVIVGENGCPDDNTCPICLSEYSPQQTLKMLPNCLHRFHAECIDLWLRSNAACPLCRSVPPRV